ncbi:Imm15 family immunity protein [Nocardia sp. NPDC052001]|uniref:Imm15 family immunity protein n=1 Tax=Nocardia sp. NPDC052001 TaxID=3154853 RepID=UPI00343BDA2B
MFISTFDEEPLWYRLAEIEYLSQLPIVDRNRLLIGLAIEKLLGEGDGEADEGSRYLRMVSVTGWWDVDERGWTRNDGTKALLAPNIWIGNKASEPMRHFRMAAAESECAAFVKAAVPNVEEYRLFENWKMSGGERFSVNRVYVCPVRADVPDEWIA